MRRRAGAGRDLDIPARMHAQRRIDRGSILGLLQSDGGFSICDGITGARLRAAHEAGFAFAERHVAHRAIQRAILAVGGMALHAFHDVPPSTKVDLESLRKLLVELYERFDPIQNKDELILAANFRRAFEFTIG